MARAGGCRRALTTTARRGRVSSGEPRGLILSGECGEIGDYGRCTQGGSYGWPSGPEPAGTSDTPLSEGAGRPPAQL